MFSHCSYTATPPSLGLTHIRLGTDGGVGGGGGVGEAVVCMGCHHQGVVPRLHVYRYVHRQCTLYYLASHATFGGIGGKRSQILVEYRGIGGLIYLFVH